MQTRRHFSFALSTAGLAALLMLTGLTGCDENEDVINSGIAALALSPAYAAINQWTHAEQAPLTLEVSGGTAPFTWTASNGTLGALNNGNDPYARFAVYSATAGKEGLNIVTITDSKGWEAHARILQDTLSIALAGAATATPNVLTLTETNQQVQVTVASGVLPLRWNVSNPVIGNVQSTESRIAYYTRVSVATGINTLTVSDSQGLSATATFLQP